ncbi:MAG: MarR family winged helix-turn-helix transcriptional regulator [Dermatophilaceae bacterium]
MSVTLDERTTQCLGDELVRLVKVLIAMRQHAATSHPHVDHSHFPVLFNLAAEPRRVSDLAGCVHADVSTVSRQVSHLVDHGLVAKAPDPRDGRVQILSLTDEGRQAIAEITAARGRWLRAVLADWSQPDAQQLLVHITHFADSLESAKNALHPTGV